MYEAFYGFKERPFSMLPDPGFLFLSKKHQAALTLLEYGLLNQVGFCVITGEPGAGKTTIVRALLERIGDNITVGLITNTHQSFGGLLDWVLSAFDLHRPNLTSVEMHQIFMEYLIEEYANNRTVLLIVDEAQNMQPDTLEELRMLSNVNSDKDQLLQVVLSGQPALKEMLIRPELMQFAQRISVDYHLAALNVEETCGYIQHRLVTAGAQKDIFTPAACERIYNYSGGTPRLINLLCETVLVYGFADQKEMIDFELVDEMVHERMKDSVVPIVNRDIAKRDNKEASKRLEKDFPWISPQRGAQKLKAEVTVAEKQQSLSNDVAPVITPVVEKLSLNEIPESKKEEVPQGGRIESVITGADKRPAQSLKENARASVGAVDQARARAQAQIQVQSKAKVQAQTQAQAQAPAPGSIADVIPVVERESGDKKRKPFIKYVVISIVFVLVLIMAWVMLDRSGQIASKTINSEIAELQKQQEQERLRLEQLQIEAALLEEERDAALTIEEEKRAKEAAEKLAAEQAEAERLADEAAQKEAELNEARRAAAEKAALAAQLAEKKRIREQQKKQAIANKKRQQQYAAARKKRQAAKIEEEKRLKEQEEMRRLELEWFEKERQALKALEAS